MFQCGRWILTLTLLLNFIIIYGLLNFSVDVFQLGPFIIKILRRSLSSSHEIKEAAIRRYNSSIVLLMTPPGTPRLLRSCFMIFPAYVNPAARQVPGYSIRSMSRAFFFFFSIQVVVALQELPDSSMTRKSMQGSISRLKNLLPGIQQQNIIESESIRRATRQQSF